MRIIGGVYPVHAPSLSKSIFDRLAEVKEAPKRSKTGLQAYKWYVKARFANEVKIHCRAMILLDFCFYPPKHFFVSYMCEISYFDDLEVL